MKNLLLTLCFALFSGTVLFAQNMPQGMNYQGVARDIEGQPLLEKTISLKIDLTATKDSKKEIWYSETHKITTNNLGLFTIAIGNGERLKGTFVEVPWSSEQIWMEVAIDENGGQDFEFLGANQLLAVPYAFHAATSNELVRHTDGTQKLGDYWSVYGNTDSDPNIHFLGNQDNVDLAFRINNVERMRLSPDGLRVEGTVQARTLGIGQHANIGSYLNVGSNTDIGGELNVGLAAHFKSTVDIDNDLRTLEDAHIGNSMTVGGKFDVEGDANFNLDVNIGQDLDVGNDARIHNDLFVDEDVEINITGGETIVHGDLTVQDIKQTYLTGTLEVDGVTDVNNTFNVTNNNITNLTGVLNVQGNSNLYNNLTVFDQKPTYLTGILTVDGATTINNTLDVTGNISTDNCLSSGDANRAMLKFNPNVINTNDGAFANYPLQLSGNGATQGIAIQLNAWEPTRNFVAFFAGDEMRGRIEGKNNFLFSTVNDASHDLFDFDPDDAKGVAGGDTTNQDASNEVQDADNEPIPTTSIMISQANEPNAEEIIELIILAVDFIGAIVELASSFTSIPFDPVDIFESALAAIVAGADLGVFIGFGIANVGVAYESGSGDYAEWLPKYEIHETLNFGDVVGVIGGEISKDFENAENFMVISAAPAVIGNMPQPDEEDAFETVAFIGQVPVKVRGVVKIGDYILPSGDGDGLAIAVHPDAMRAKDFKRIVGVAWEDSDEDKKEIYQMINTAVGINQNDMAYMIDQMQVVMNEMQKAIEQINPEYAGHFFDTDSKTVKLAADYTVSTTHETAMEGYFMDKSFSSREELGLLVTEALEEKTGVDLSNYPVIQKMLLDPEYAEAAEKHYSDLLVEYLAKMDELKN